MSEFLNHCRNAIRKVPEENLTLFNNAKDHESRIKSICKFANEIPIKIEEDTKNLDFALAEKTKGNAFYVKKDYKNAMKCYNLGIVHCPQDTDSSKETLAILFANRSATFFDLQEYRKVLNDIDYIMEIDKYPKHLLHKVLLRKSKCYDALRNEKSANEVYEQTFESFKYSGLDQKTIDEKIEEIKMNREKFKNLPLPVHEMKIASSCEEEMFSPSEIYIASLDKVNFEQDMVQGRYARASDKIQAGQIIVQENPHCSVLLQENSLTNCQNCLISTNQIIPCRKCSTVVFCSSNCERIANRTFHKTECKFQKELLKSGASINCSMALRLITQKDLRFFIEKRKVFQDFMRDNCKKTFKRINPYKSDDYNTVFFLCRNEFSRNKEELLHFSFMSVYLLKLLKTSDYFQPKNTGSEENGCFGDVEIFIATLILRHLELLQFNSHEIAELRNSKEGEMKSGDSDSSYHLDFIGAGLYPTASLFNHSCDPSIIRYNIGNKLIVRAIKPIEEGEIIYENYGPMYTTMKREFRQKFLSNRYWFECLCPPCVEYWPMFEKMNENELRIKCNRDKCPYVFVIDKMNMNPFLECEYCGNKTNLFPIMKNLMVLENVLPNAEHFYSNGYYHEAIKCFLEALNILYENLKAPCPDMVKIQQRLRTCFVHYGNKSINYVPQHLC